MSVEDAASGVEDTTFGNDVPTLPVHPTLPTDPGSARWFRRRTGRDDAAATTPGQWRELVRRFRQDRLAMVGLVFILLIIFVAVFAVFLAPYDPSAIPHDLHPGQGPSWQHLLGTDELGRDILSRLIYGAKVSMYAAFGIVLIALLVALPLGLISGFYRGAADSVISRVMDALFTFPPLLLALTVAVLLGDSLRITVVAIAIPFIPGLVRIIRAQVLSAREESYIEASRSVGANNRRLIVRHVLPNVASPLIVQSAVLLGFALLAEAGLAFLGLGPGDTTASWGSMLSSAYNYINQWSWPLIPPGVAIFLTVLAFNLLGDGMRDALGRERFKVDEATVATRT
jgi:ABC-type dipeptide/oligopeptide/nickel transport system permease subunit